MNEPGVLHPPPADLATTRLPIAAHPGPWRRIHRTAYGPIFFDTSPRFRFNPTDGAYGVLYCGENLECCFVETLLRLDTPQQTTVRSLSRSRDLEPRAVCEIRFARPLRLVDLTGEGLAQIGAHETLCSGPYDSARPWSRALWSHPSQPDGLMYRARHNPKLLSVAIFDRARVDVTARGSLPLLAIPVRELADLLDRYNVSVRP